MLADSYSSSLNRHWHWGNASSPLPCCFLGAWGWREGTAVPPLCRLGVWQGLEGVVYDMTWNMVTWIIIHLPISGRIHSGTWSTWVGEHTLRRRFGQNVLWKHWVIAFFYDNTGRGNDFNFVLLWRREKHMGGFLGSRELVGTVGVATQ